MSLADLIVLCVVRSVVFVIFSLKDSYLQSNLLAILIDLAPHITHMHSAVCERMINIICKLGTKYVALQKRITEISDINAQFEDHYKTSSPHRNTPQNNIFFQEFLSISERKNIVKEAIEANDDSFVRYVKRMKI